MSQLPALETLCLDLRSSQTVIVCPQTNRYQVIAEQLCGSLQQVTGHRPNVVADIAEEGELGKGPILVLGNLMDSQLARSLYYQAYDFTDHSWPSPGGHVVRTLRDPLGTGAHVIVLGGSDPEGVADAADELISIVKQSGPEMHYLNHVKLGRWAEEINSYTAALLADEDGVWERVGGAGSWFFMRNITKAALGFLRTGDEGYLPLFLREFRYFTDHDAKNISAKVTSGTMSAVHGFLHAILMVWDLVRDHDFFDDATRRQVDEAMLAIYRHPQEGPARILDDSCRWEVRSNHGTISGLDAFFGGRYYLRRFGLEEGSHWMRIARRFFETQMHSSKPLEDNWAHQWSFSMYNTLIYALASGRNDYVKSEHFTKAAERALLAYPNGCAPFGYLSACSEATGDMGYLSGAGNAETVARQSAAMSPRDFELIRSFCTGREPQDKSDLLGVASAEVAELWNDTVHQRGLNPGEIFSTTVPDKDRFDVISIREGWGADDFHLIVEGISGGHHAHFDASCIKFMLEEGVLWLGQGEHASDKGFAWSGGGCPLGVTTTVRAENGVAVTFNGSGPENLHRYARRLYAVQCGDYLGSGTALERLGATDWQRHVLRKRGAWTLVIDSVLSRDAGELWAQRYWHVNGEVSKADDGPIYRQSADGKQLSLHLHSVGINDARTDEKGCHVETVRCNVQDNSRITFATLFQVTAGSAAASYRLDSQGDTCRIRSDGGVDIITLSNAGTGLNIESPTGKSTLGQADGDEQSAMPGKVELLPLTVTASKVSLVAREMKLGAKPIRIVAARDDGTIACGNDDGEVAVFNAEGKPVLQAAFDSEISALHISDSNLLVGEDRGALTCLSLDGTQRWQVVIPYEVRTWEYYSQGKTRLRELVSADINDDGRQEVLACCADRGLYAFDDQGKQLWRVQIRDGLPSAMTLGEFRGQRAIYLGTSDIFIHGWCLVFSGKGEELKWFARPDLLNWGFHCQMRDIRFADINGDGRPEIINALDTSCRQLIVYNDGLLDTRDHDVLWDADVAGSPDAILIIPGHGRSDNAAMVVCCSSSGYVSAFDGGTGERLWYCFVGEAGQFLSTHGSDAIVAVSKPGRMFMIDYEGELIGCNDLGTEVTAMLRPGDHRKSTTVPIGTSDGRVLVLGEM